MFRKVLVTLFVLGIPAIVMAQTRVDVDRHKDFRQYKTFTVQVGPIVRADGVVDERNTLAENRLRDAITREFEARGMEPTEVGADLVVRVSSRDTERTAVYSTGYQPYWGWGFRRRFGYWGPRAYWGYGPYAGDVWTRRYVDNAVMIDVVDRATGDLVYRAQVSDEVGKDLDKNVTKAVDKALKKFPVKELSSN
jgi:hypothetical protein